MASNSTTRADGTPVPFNEAKRLWIEAGLPALEEVARTYGRYVTYQELADLLQVRTGVTTRMQMRHWIGPVLGGIAEKQKERSDEPILTSLVVRSDGTVGDGYSVPLVDRGLEVPDDLDEHAASERLRCYEHFGATLPAGGGRPMLTAQLATRRSRRRPAPPTRDVVCPSCFLRLPASGRCDTCDPLA